MECDDGRVVQINEGFALGRVKQPLLCAGKFLRRGWNIKQEDSGLCLSNPEGQDKNPFGAEESEHLHEGSNQNGQQWAR